MQIKRFFFISLLIISAGSLDAQSNKAEVCEDNLITTFTKYFNKGEINPDSVQKAKKIVERNNSLSSAIYQSTIDNVISVGKTFLGIPYRWGGTRESGFDCSGFIKYIFEWFGVKLPRTSREMVHYGEYVRRDELQKGDLVFFTGRNAKSGVIGHIGIVVEATGDVVKLMHSSSSKGVNIENLNESKYLNARYITARRLPLDQQQASNRQ